LQEFFKPDFLEKLRRRLTDIERYLGEKQWLTGDEINYPDFALGDLLCQLVKFEPACLGHTPRLRAYLDRFVNLPNVKDYMASDEFKSRPCMLPRAMWRGDDAERYLYSVIE
uniref:GST C-terminal domain-containing protein n=1 Tax=Mesocestoides corti TaxID=53468 RepID=A0A5K3G200_MESCO